jgi:hypothetical protein
LLVRFIEKNIRLGLGTNGWSYETMLVAVNLVIVTTGGGNLTLTRLFTQDRDYVSIRSTH